MSLRPPIQAVCFDWGGTLMSEQGPQDRPMADWPQVQRMPGAAECLALLAGRLPLAIATNASISRRADIVRALARVGLDGCFQHIFCFTDIGCRKDDRRFWQVVESGLGVPMAALAMVGDSLQQDARAPRTFGVQGVWLRPGPAGPAAPSGLAGLAATAWPEAPVDGGAPVPTVANLPQFAHWVLAARQPAAPADGARP